MSCSRTQAEKAAAFVALHEGAAFVIPNPWDAGSAKLLEANGFEALATTSSGFAFTLGRPDGTVTLEEMAAHVTALDAATNLPVAADLENGYGPAPAHAAEAIRRIAEAGAVGGSIEDWDPSGHLYEIAEATERVAGAAEAGRALDFPFILTARAENHIREHPDLDDTIARLRAYEEAGADVLYAPGLDLEGVRAVLEATTKPLNVLARRDMSVAAIAEAGGQRISLGGALTWVGTAAVTAAAQRIREGDLSVLSASSPPDEWLNS